MNSETRKGSTLNTLLDVCRENARQWSEWAGEHSAAADAIGHDLHEARHRRRAMHVCNEKAQTWREFADELHVMLARRGR